MTGAAEQAHRLARYAIIGAYAVAVEWIAIRAGNPADLWWWLAEVPFFLWIMSPIAVPLLLRMRHWLLTGGIATMAAYSVYIYETGMFGPGARSTSPLIFIFLPLYQWLGAALLITLTAILGRKKAQ